MNSFGRIFRVHIFGESHGRSVGVIIDGCPPGIKLDEKDLRKDLKRRMPGEAGTTARKETDVPHIKSGVFNNRTTGSPILIEFINEDIRSTDYEKFRTKPRPGQADFAAGVKYGGFNDYRGGGHFSARLTIGLVAAGAVAKKVLGGVKLKADLTGNEGCEDHHKLIKKCISEGDSAGGIITCIIKNLPIGIGELFFDSVESVISHAVFSVPSVKGIEFGAGFRSASMTGSEYNDIIVDLKGKTATNNCGGITGGLSNGNQICFRVALRPPSSVLKEQDTIDLKTGKKAVIKITGRHDVCPALRAPVIIEAAAAVAVCDLFMLSKIYSCVKK